MALKRLLALALMLSFWGVGFSSPWARSAPAENPAFQEKLRIDLNKGLIFLSARDVEIAEVLRSLADKTGIGLRVGEAITGKVNLTMNGVSLEEALTQLCASRAILYEFDQESKTYLVSSAFIPLSHPAAVPVMPMLKGQERAPLPFTLPAVKDERERLYDSQGRLLYRPGELLVRFREGTTRGECEALHRKMGSRVIKLIEHLQLYRVFLREGLPEKEAGVLYSNSGIVATVERNALRYPMLTTPNDLYFDDPNTGQWGLKAIQMPAAWDISRGREEIVVADIDTGADNGHPDLAPNLLGGWNFANGNSDVSDLYGHGTPVAGVIAALGNNGRGIAGIGWRLRVMPLKVMDDNYDIAVSDIVEALDYAIAKNVRIVNFSLGGALPSDEEKAAFARLGQAGILAVCAAGNSRNINDNREANTYPASYDLDNIISVASSDPSDNLAATSFYGQINVDLMAPGDGIWSTWSPSALIAEAQCRRESYCKISGTSMAAPHVTGVAGLILSRNPGLSYSQVKSILLDTVDKVPGLENRLVSGGRLNALAALSNVVCLVGNVTGSGAIGLEDAILSLRILSSLDSTTSICRTADVDGDGRIGLAEADYALQILAGLRQ